MKKIVTVAICAMLLSVSSAAVAASGPYVGFSAGLFMPSDSDVSGDFGEFEVSFDNGGVVSGAVGYAAPYGLRFDAEASYRNADTDRASIFGGDLDGEVNAISLMGNVYFDIPTGGPVRPYIMGGVGVSSVEVDIDDAGIEEDDTVMSGQAGAGVSFEVSRNITLDLGYRYFITEDVNLGDDGEASFDGHNVTAGIRFMF
jgi:opacity protein-like surface antigen